MKIQLNGKQIRKNIVNIVEAMSNNNITKAERHTTLLK